MVRPKKRVPWFDADKEIEPGVGILVVGKSHSGKSWLLHDLMRRMAGFGFQYGVAFTPSRSSRKMFAEYMPEDFILPPDPDLLKAELDMAKARTDRRERKGLAPEPNFIFADDTAFAKRFMRAGDAMGELFMNGRHYGPTTRAVVIQYPKSASPDTRQGADIVAVAYENQVHLRKFIYESWFNMIPTRKEFDAVFDEATLNYGFLIINTRKGNTARRWQDCISWYRVETDPGLTPAPRLLPDRLYAIAALKRRMRAKLEALQDAAIAAGEAPAAEEDAEPAREKEVVRLDPNGEEYCDD